MVSLVLADLESILRPVLPDMKQRSPFNPNSKQRSPFIPTFSTAIALSFPHSKQRSPSHYHIQNSDRPLSPIQNSDRPLSPIQNSDHPSPIQFRTAIALYLPFKIAIASLKSNLNSDRLFCSTIGDRMLIKLF